MATTKDNQPHTNPKLLLKKPDFCTGSSPSTLMLKDSSVRDADEDICLVISKVPLEFTPDSVSPRIMCSRPTPHFSQMAIAIVLATTQNSIRKGKRNWVTSWFKEAWQSPSGFMTIVEILKEVNQSWRAAVFASVPALLTEIKLKVFLW